MGKDGLQIQGHPVISNIIPIASSECSTTKLTIRGGTSPDGVEMTLIQERNHQVETSCRTSEDVHLHMAAETFSSTLQVKEVLGTREFVLRTSTVLYNVLLY